jgi:HlyD family secretion protein
VENSEKILRPGMTATVSVVTKESNGVLTVPSEAFRFRPPVVERSRGFSLESLFMPRMPRNRGQQTAQAVDGSRTLYVLRDGAPQAVRVRTGVTDGLKTEIVSGLAEGDEVIVSTATRRP